MLTGILGRILARFTTGILARIVVRFTTGVSARILARFFTGVLVRILASFTTGILARILARFHSKSDWPQKTLINLSDSSHNVACEQALLFGRAKRASRERASEGPRTRETRFAHPNRRACSQASHNGDIFQNMNFLP